MFKIKFCENGILVYDDDKFDVDKMCKKNDNKKDNFDKDINYYKEKNKSDFNYFFDNKRFNNFERGIDNDD